MFHPQLQSEEVFGNEEVTHMLFGVRLQSGSTESRLESTSEEFQLVTAMTASNLTVKLTRFRQFHMCFTHECNSE